MIAKTEKDFEGLKKIGRVVAEIRDFLKDATAPGMTTKEIDDIAGRLFKEKGAGYAPIYEYDLPGYT